jgi:eukaryotic-like serine/threonine-protein kinase
MSLAIGTRMGPYEVVAAIGAGGMGEVYRARDTRLGRDVAVKVLPPAFAVDAERRARFEREAQTVAALSHPHIVSIFDTGVHEGQIFVVMELLDGETLRERVTNGPLPIRKAIEYGVQVARGLAAAHDKGLVHRDLKPDNIFLLADGHVKILDFGLARSAGGENAGSGATETVAALTDPGLVMGTIGYMAPEQVRGKVVDGRADLFAFGAVLYEMITGARAFQRDTPADTMTAILKEDPPELAGIRTDLPPALDRIIRHCLEKNPAERFQSARDVAFALEALSGTAATTVVAVQSGATERARPSTNRRELAAWLLALAAIVAVGVAVWRWPAAPTSPPVSRFSLTLDASDAALSATPVVSPNGQSIVIQVSPSKDTRLRLRRLDAPELVPLPGTENGAAPFWSPDGQSIGFIADRALKRFDLATSSVRPIATLGGGTLTPAWGGDGTILLSSLLQPLHRVSERGGTPAPMGALDQAANEAAQIHPVFLPDGRRFLYLSVRAATSAIALGSLDSDRRTTLDVTDTRIVWAGDDRVIFRRADALYMQGITYEPLALVGDPTQLVAEVESVIVTGRRESASAAGVLAYSERSNRRLQFRWYSREGRPLATVGEPGQYATFDLSHDGRRIVAALRAGPSVIGGNLWQIDAEQGTRARITAGQASDVDPRWSANGATVLFGSSRDPARSPFRVGLAAGTPEPVWKYGGRMFSADDWSPDGKWLLFHDASVPVLEAREMDASGAPKGEPVVVARALTGTVDQAHMSPDGKWVAYNSNESGRYEVYVTPFPATGERFSVSRAGGSQPTWNGDSSELYYLTPEGALVAVKVSTSGGKFVTSPPIELARPRLAAVSSSVEQYAPHPSGTKFLFLDNVGDEKNLSIGVVLNWPSLVPRAR